MITDKAGDLGFDADRLDHLGRAIEQDIEGEAYDGCVLHVARGGETVMHAAFGYADRANKTELETDNLFISFSCAKQLTATVVLNRVERGDFALTTKVADVIPEFGNRGKENINLYHMLTHQAGLMFGVPPLPAEELGNLDAIVEATCRAPVESVPGEKVHYSAIVAHAVMAEMVRRAEGGNRPFREILRQDLFEPLGMNDTALGKPDHLADRVCPVVVRNRAPGVFEPEMLEGLGNTIGPETEIPAGGVVFSAEDVSKFANMLREGGAANGARILSPGMIDIATRNWTGDKANGMWSFAAGMRGWEMWPAYLGLGFFLRGEAICPSPFGTMASPRTYGGLGAGSNMFWIDPARDLTCVFLSTGLIEETRNVERFQKVSDLVLAADTAPVTSAERPFTTTELRAIAAE